MTKETDKNDLAPTTKPLVGGMKSGQEQLQKANERPTKPLAPEAQGGAGAGRKWPGDS